MSTPGPGGIPGAMLRLDAALRRHRRLVLGVWLVAVLASLPFAAHQSDELTGGGFTAKGSDSAAVQEAVARDYPEVAAATLAAVLVPRPDARPGDLAAALAATQRSVSGVDGATVVPAGRQQAEAAARARPDRPVVLPMAIAGGEDAAIDIGTVLRGRLGIVRGTAGSAADGRVEVHLVGQGALWAAFLEEAKAGVGDAEVRGFPVIAIVLLAVFGSLAAGLLPLGLGLASLLVTGALIYGLSTVAQMSTFVTNISSMIGIGVAVDYSLFVLARYRQEIRAGRDPEEARAVAVATSGTAVVFSGLTVVASLAGLFLTGSTALGSMAVGAMVVVLVAVLATSTLLPVLISLLGHRVDRRARWASRRRSATPAGRHRQGFWPRWMAAVLRRPTLSLVGAVGVLVVLALPVLDMSISNSALRQLDQGHEFRAGAAAVSDVAGPGALGPATVLVSFDGAADAGSVQAVRSALTADPEVSTVDQPVPAADGRSVLLRVALRSDPESQPARDALDRLRGSLPAAAGPDATVRIGGTTANTLDFDRLVSGSLGKILLFVLALSFVVLLILLRSVVLPLEAVAMNLLSVAAAYGVMVAIFQWGWLSWLGLEAAPSIDTVTPPLVLAVAFGLSMDYEVFLLTRIRERYAATGDTRRSVTEALGDSAPVITSAALIMVAVFLAFVSAGLPSVQRLGIGCAVAIALDATVVRLVLVPALMDRLGRWNWWLPAPVARVLPAAPDEAAVLLPDREPATSGRRA